MSDISISGKKKIEIFLAPLIGYLCHRNTARVRPNLTIIFDEYEFLAASGYFDPDYYLTAHSDLRNLQVDPLLHYLEQGCDEGRNPSARFDPSHYLAQCKTLPELPRNPLMHYLTVGVGLGFTALPQAPSSCKQTGTAKSSRPSGRSKKKAAVRTSVIRGGIDTFGYVDGAGGWLFSGWLKKRNILGPVGQINFVQEHSHDRSLGSAIVATYALQEEEGMGFIAFVYGKRHVMGHLKSISFEIDSIRCQAVVCDSTAFLTDEPLLDSVRTSLASHFFSVQQRDLLMATACRPIFRGQDTLTSLSEPVLLEIDDAIVCPPGGVFLVGWMISARGAVRSLRVRSGTSSVEVNVAHAVIVPRPDVAAAVGYHYGLSDDRCGFMCYVPKAVLHGKPPYLEVELHNGEIGFKAFQLSPRLGIEAIRRVLQDFHVGWGDIDSAYDHVLGPAVASLNTMRLRQRSLPLELSFGRAPRKVSSSIVIPLYGRIDFLEYQLALFSRHRSIQSHEIIYVLDDPGKYLELKALSLSVYSRFRVPFRVLCHKDNLGFAPASNAGLAVARGQFVCFLNSDIFPITEDWLERLVARLKNDPQLGVIGPRLLFDDGSIQHEGCIYSEISEYGNWKFINHVNKGQRPRNGEGVIHCELITGACMVMKRSLARKLGGFDESYVIGDFEDAELCRRISALGLSCAVDSDVRLYHLERKSQAASNQNWRMNLTLYNAWVHQRRWFGQVSENKDMIFNVA